MTDDWDMLTPTTEEKKETKDTELVDLRNKLEKDQLINDLLASRLLKQKKQKRKKPKAIVVASHPPTPKSEPPLIPDVGSLNHNPITNAKFLPNPPKVEDPKNESPLPTIQINKNPPLVPETPEETQKVIDSRMARALKIIDKQDKTLISKIKMP